MIAHGGARTTKDIDFLVDTAPENVARIKKALRFLPDRAVEEIADDDLERYPVVRIRVQGDQRASRSARTACAGLGSTSTGGSAAIRAITSSRVGRSSAL